MGLETIFGITAACSLIVIVLAAFENLRAWGTAKGVKDGPNALALAFVAIAQMYQPVEPFAGVIIDLRALPLVLAGAFLSWPSALLVVASVCAARFGIGGQGVAAGLLGIALAVACGGVWRWLFRRESSFPSYMILGAMTCLSMAGALLLAPEIRVWFFTNAAPLLAISYIGLVPVFAWLLDCAPHIQTASQRVSSDALARKGVELLPLPSFLHQARVGTLLNGSEDVVGLLFVRVSGASKLFRFSARIRSEEILDTAFLKLAASRLSVTVGGKIGADTLLLPLTHSQVRDLDGVRDTIKDVLGSRPLIMRGRDRIWVSYELGLLGADHLDHIEHLRPAKIAANTAQISTIQPSRPKTQSSLSAADDRFLPISDMDLLFTKAELLNRSAQ